MNKVLSALVTGALAISGSHSAIALVPPTGLNVYVEEWNPIAVDSEKLVVLEKNPTILSDTLNNVWAAFRNEFLSTEPQKLQAQNLLHSLDASIPTGISLYDRSGNTNLPPELTLPAQPDFQLMPRGQNGIQANFRVTGSTLSFCATTPTFLDRHEDPCATLAVDVNLSVGLQVTDTPGGMLQVTNATVTLSNFHPTEENTSTAILEGVAQVVAALGGPNYRQLIVSQIDRSYPLTVTLQKAIDPLNGRIGSYEQRAMIAINDLLKPQASISRLIHTAVWEQNTANTQLLSILFAPPSTGVTINPSNLGGQIGGTLTFNDTVKTLPASCQTLDSHTQFVGQVQTGPRPVLGIQANDSAVFGIAPVQALNVAFVGGPLQGRECKYSLQHLVVGMQNSVNFNVFPEKLTGLPQKSDHLGILPTNWSSPVVLGPNGAIIAVGDEVAPGTSSRPVATLNRPTALSSYASTGVSPGVSRLASAPILSRRLNTRVPQVLDLVGFDEVQLTEGQGARQRSQRLEAINPVDPAQSAIKGTSWATSPGGAPATLGLPATGTSVAPAWGAVTTVRGTSTFNNTSSIRTLQPQTQQPAQIQAPTSLSTVRQ